jgi:Kef-type K+ transport system membrane component KefB
LVQDAAVVSQVSNIGIMFLLFLLGLDLDPKDLVRSLRRTTLITLGSTLIFAFAGVLIGLSTGFTSVESLVLGGAMTFSSTIIGLKLLPTTVLHHQRLGAIMISILLLQDLLAVAFILLLGGAGGGGDVWTRMALSGLALPVLVGLAWAAARYVLLPMMARFDTIREYVFLIAIGWCLGLAQLSSSLGLSAEVGAFIAGVALAVSPIAQYLAESLRPLRDFFLVLFFFHWGPSSTWGCWATSWSPRSWPLGPPWSSSPGSFAACCKAPGSPRVARGRSASASGSSRSSPSSSLRWGSRPG